jgi:hypothetical protein
MRPRPTAIPASARDRVWQLFSVCCQTV